jgi:Cellulase (glycosyl hydrolase family 5)
VKRNVRLVFAVALLALLSSAAAQAAPHMWIGFQDDASFRWRPERVQNLADAQQANTTIVRAWVFWPQVAPSRPANAADSFDPAYRWDDLDELIRNAQFRGMEVLLSPWGTPKWANGGKTPNYAPTNIADWSKFIHALADRYSGKHQGYPAVRFWSIWNEPNLNQFLAPQFVGKKDTSPAIYAKLFRAAYSQIKSTSSTAQVAIGETGPRGRDKPLGSSSLQDSHSPGKFAQLLAAVKPRLAFDAWAHHPYGTTFTAPPLQKVKWPNVTLASMSRFETSIDTWFQRKNTPIWITEYGYQTAPAQPKGVSLTTQAADLRSALTATARDPRVQMFIWFTYRDDAGNPWKSGVVANDGSRKPSYAALADAALPLDGRDLVLKIAAGRSPVVSFPARDLARNTAPGEGVGVTYSVYDGTKPMGVHQPLLPMGRDSWVTLPVELTPEKGHTYTVIVSANAHGTYIRRQLTLIAS